MAKNKSSSTLKIVDEQIDGSKPVTSESQNLAEAEVIDIEGVRENMQDVLAEASIKELIESLNIQIKSGETREQLFQRIFDGLFDSRIEIEKRNKNAELFSNTVSIPIQKEIIMSHIKRLALKNKLVNFRGDIWDLRSLKPPYLQELYEYVCKITIENNPLSFVENIDGFIGNMNKDPQWKDEILESTVRRAIEKDPITFMKHIIRTYKKDPITFNGPDKLWYIKNKPYFKEILETAVKNAIEKDPENASKYIKYMNEERYIDLLEEYKRLFDRIKNLSKRQDNPNLQDKVMSLDDDRHQVHLKLLDVGSQLGKDKQCVFADIIRKDKTLDELGLPEFSILVENDLIYGDRGWYCPDRDEIMIHELADKKSVIPDDKCLLVFTDSDDYGNKDEISHFDKQDRAEALAEAIGGEYFNQEDRGGYHDSAGYWITGVIIPKKDLEKVAAIIRDNPEKYRLKKEFFSEEEKKYL